MSDSTIKNAQDVIDALVRKNNQLTELLSRCRPFIKDKADWGFEYESDLLSRIDNEINGQEIDNQEGGDPI